MSVCGALTTVLAHYDVGEMTAFSRIERGFVNEAWYVETETGNYVLKRRNQSLSQVDLVTAQHMLLEYLHHNGFPVPGLIRTKLNTTFLNLDHRVYELQEYRPGTPCDRTLPSHLSGAAHTLAHYHRLVSTFDHPAFHRNKTHCSPDKLKQIIHQLQAGNINQGNAKAAHILLRLQHHAQQLSDILGDIEAFTHLVIHGDFYAGNIHFMDEYVTGVFDFDNAQWCPRIQEVAEAVIYFAQESRKRFKYIVYPGVLELEKLQGFLEAYTETIILSEKEILALPQFIRTIWLCRALVPPLRPKLRLESDLDALQELVTLADWAAEKTEEIIRIGLSIRSKRTRR